MQNHTKYDYRLLKFNENGELLIIWLLILGGRWSPRQIKTMELIEPGSSPLTILLMVRSLTIISLLIRYKLLFSTYELF